jgi:hypothetical protein
VIQDRLNLNLASHALEFRVLGERDSLCAEINSVMNYKALDAARGRDEAVTVDYQEAAP